MKKIIAFAGSNSKNSINKQLAVYAANQVDNVDVTVLDLNDFELPMYSIDLEMEKGIPDNAQKFINIIKDTDGIILSLAENNGSYSAVFKNLFDWMSRIEKNLWHNKPMLLMATSPGGRGGSSVLATAKQSFPRLGGHIVSGFSLPSFGKNFIDNHIISTDLKADLLEAVFIFNKAI